MPRKRKRKKETPQQARRKDRDKALAEYWTRMIRAGLAVKEDYDAAATDTEAYLRSNHEALYDDPATKLYFMDVKGAAAMSVPKVAQMRGSIGPRLYKVKPVRTCTPLGSDSVMKGLSNVLEAYLNYTVRETKYVKQLRKATDDGLVRGRAFLYQVWDDVRSVVTSRYKSSKDVVFDPDVTDIEDAEWVALRFREPFWKTKRRISEKWRYKNMKPRTAVREDGAPRPEDDINSNHTVMPTSADQTVYWVVLSKMGKGFRGMGDKWKRQKDENDFVRMEVVLDHECPLAEGEWEVPLYLDAEWPLSYMDLIEPLDHHWPESVSGQVLPLQKGVDLLTTMRMSSCKNRDRFAMLVDERLEGINQDQLRSGTMADSISVKVPNGQTLDGLTKVLDFGQGSPESGAERDFLLNQMDNTTGATEALVGGQSDSTKERSATAVQQKSEASSVRIADLQTKSEEFATDAARKEALIVRLMLDPDEVEPFVDVDQIGLYYLKIEMIPGVEIPVRDTREQSEREENPKGGALTLEQVAPQASKYYEDPMEALEAAAQAWQLLQESTDPKIQQVALALEAGGMATEDGLPIGISIAPVTVQRVWQDTAGLSPEELARELSYEIASGSGQKVNKEAEQANADNLTQTVLPIMLQNMDYEGANTVLQIRDEAYDIPQDQRVMLQPPPPPPPTAAPGGDAPPSEEG